MRPSAIKASISSREKTRGVLTVAPSISAEKTVKRIAKELSLLARANRVSKLSVGISPASEILESACAMESMEVQY